MDVFTPKQKANGAAAILVVSGGWSSAHEFPPNASTSYPKPANERANLPGPLQRLRGARNQNAAPVKFSDWLAPALSVIKFPKSATTVENQLCVLP
jgi:hypothetical protein